MRLDEHRLRREQLGHAIELCKSQEQGVVLGPGLTPACHKLCTRVTGHEPPRKALSPISRLPRVPVVRLKLLVYHALLFTELTVSRPTSAVLPGTRATSTPAFVPGLEMQVAGIVA